MPELFAPAKPDRLRLEGAQLETRIGVPEEERVWPQQLVLDIEFTLDARPAARTDSIAHTIDYAELWNTVIEVARARPRALLETLAEDISTALFAHYPLTELQISILKPAALRARGVAGVRLTIQRTRP